MRPYRANPIEEEESEFVYGGHCKLGDRAFIIPADAEYDADYAGFEPAILGVIEVRPETVGQSTGLYDKNGKKEAYQHDLIKHGDRNSSRPIEIIWKNGSWQGEYVGENFSFRLNEREMTEAEVIGNTHQNPELLEQKNKVQ